MYLIYVDEQECEKEKYSAAIALVFPASKVSEFRIKLISRIREVFQRSQPDATPFPDLHASELPKELEDSKKIELFSAVIEEALKVCIGVYRVGYHWNDSHISEQFHDSKKENARLASFTALQHELTQYPFSPNVLIQEFDESHHKAFAPWLNRTDNLEQLTQLQLLGNDFRNHLSENIGYYYAPKRDYQLYATDFVAYYLKLMQREEITDFQSKLIEAAPNIDRFLLRNEIVTQRTNPTVTKAAP